MIISNAAQWEDVFKDLDKHYKRKEHQFWNSYDVAGENPIAGLANSWHEKFFGPNVCQIFIINAPYGVVGTGSDVHIEWPPPGYDDAKEAIKSGFKYWAKYELHFFLDLTIVKKARDVDPPSADKLMELLQQVGDSIKSDCESEMSDFGWTFDKTFDESATVRAADFYDILDKFYS